MSKLDDFKSFAKTHPELINSIRNNEMTWQQYYEMYDIYGDDASVWEKYLKPEQRNDSLSKLIKNIDMESIQNHINTAQKALSFISELTAKNPEVGSNLAKGPVTPRPINKFFGD